MRHALLLPLAFLGLSGCVAPPPTTTTYVTPATTTTYTTPATSTTVMNAPAGYQPAYYPTPAGYATPTTTYVTPPPTTTVIRTR
jgi:hypothetical protein